MNREIKFRAMGPKGDWRYGLLTFNNRLDENYEWFISNDAGQPYAYAVLRETVGEYTGLKDKNGKEIFEGDVVTGFVEDVKPRIGGGETQNLKAVTATVIFDRGKFCGESNDSSQLLNLFDVETIGNKFENPDLIRG